MDNNNSPRKEDREVHRAFRKQVELKELIETEEAFVTNSILELMPLTWFEGKPIGTGKPGEITKKLLATYRKLVEETLR